MASFGAAFPRHFQPGQDPRSIRSLQRQTILLPLTPLHALFLLLAFSV